MPELNERTAVVLFSGGQDSTVCLAWALDRFERVETVGFTYGQRHDVEMACRPRVLGEIREIHRKWADALGDDHVLDAGVIGEVGETALTHDVAIAMDESGLPNTFVPGRNILFLTLAAALAYRRAAKHLIGGFCETDFSGYPDCRDDTVKAVQLALNLGMNERFVIHTPLMWIDKAATWALAGALGGQALIELIIEHTHTCYHGDRTHRHDWGYGCGDCPACELRRSGYERYRGRSTDGEGAHGSEP